MRTFLVFFTIASITDALLVPSPKCVQTKVNNCARRTFFRKAVLGGVAGAAAFTVAAPVVFADNDSVDTPKPHSLDNKIMLVTGGTSGIGLESAKILAAGGAHVVITARSDNKGIKAVQTVQDYLKQESIDNALVQYVLLNLDDLENVKTFPERFQSVVGKDAKIDVLLNNAGVMAIPERELTKDGYERTFQSNHLGHFALTAKLLPFLKPDARVINVSSLAYNIAAAGLDMDNLNGEKGYGPWTSYGQSKLANILFTEELQRRADAAGVQLTTTSLHPGAVNTDLARYIIGEEKWQKSKENGPDGFLEKTVNAVINRVLKTPRQGAATQVFLATTESEEKGRFYSDLKPQKLPGYAMDVAKAHALWERSEELSGVKFPL